MQRREINALMRMSDLIQVKGTKRDRRRHKIILVEVIKNDMFIREVTMCTILDRIEWQKRIHVIIPNQSFEDP